MTEIVTSKNGVAIRLTDERWSHITEEHAELAGFKREVLETIAQPERILAGGTGELLACWRSSNNPMENPLWPCTVRALATALSSPRF